jgi:hypothetical protein
MNPEETPMIKKHQLEKQIVKKMHNCHICQQEVHGELHLAMMKCHPITCDNCLTYSPYFMANEATRIEDMKAEALRELALAE